MRNVLINRRNFVKRGALLVPALPTVAHAQMHPFPGPGTRSHSGNPEIVFRGASANSGPDFDATLSCAETLNIQAGDLTVVLVSGLNNPGVSVMCGSDTMTEVKSWFSSTYNYHGRVFVKYNSTANPTATVTATWSGGGTQFKHIAGANWGGIALSSALEQSSCNVVACNDISPGATGRTAVNVSTTQAKQLLVAALINWDGGQEVTGVNGYTIHVNGLSAALASKVVTEAGTYPSGNFATTPAFDQYFCFFLTFKAAA